MLVTEGNRCGCYSVSVAVLCIYCPYLGRQRSDKAANSMSCSYNSAIYRQEAVYSYNVFAAEAKYLEMANSSNTPPQQMLSKEADRKPHELEFSRLINNLHNLERLETADCLAIYSKERLSNRADLIIALDHLSSVENSSAPGLKHYDPGFRTIAEVEGFRDE